MHLTIGKKRKKKQIWRKPKGRDNKMREKRKGRPAVVKIGYRRQDKKENILRIYNIKDLDKVRKEDILILGKIGRKKKIEIMKKAEEKKLNFLGINTGRFLKENEFKKKEETSKKDA